jgi:hypothetical protein
MCTTERMITWSLKVTNSHLKALFMLYQYSINALLRL